jgi:plastocyanin
MPKTITAVTIIIGAIGLAACGGSSHTSATSSPASSAPAQSSTAPAQSSTAQASSSGQAQGALSIAADPSGQLKFTKTSLRAKAGKVTIQFTNDAPLAHNLTIQQGTSGAMIGATPTFTGGTRAVTVTLKPGTYTFFCSVPGHRQGGMQGTLTIR